MGSCMYWSWPQAVVVKTVRSIQCDLTVSVDAIQRKAVLDKSQNFVDAIVTVNIRKDTIICYL